MLDHSLNRSCAVSFSIATLLIATPLLALEEIPTESGLSGFISAGAATTRLKSNMISGGDDFDLELIHSHNSSPDSDTHTKPSINGKVAYTWADSKTQVFLGTNMEDYLRYDLSTELGVRQALEGNDILNASFLFSAMPGKTWRDPYQTGTKRSDTNRNSSGLKLAWENIADSDVSVTLKHRKIDLDNERSGIDSAFTVAEQKLLEREGEQTSLKIQYEYNMGDGHFLVPSYTYTDFDLDGKAMANKEHLLQLSHAYFGEQWQFVTNVAFGQTDHDKRNPIYTKTQEDDIYGLSFTAFYSQPFSLENTRAMASFATYRSSSNINFYDSNISMANLGLMYIF
ncbi:MAG: DUF2860 family protein [Endozoicomonadaceae bacterium]|nr:DUF2860 family protein [Endozoicomonadaceae bacterium]